MRIQKQNWLKAIGVIFALVLPIFLIDSDYEYYLDVLSRIFIFSIFAMSLDFIMGYGKMASLGHALFFGLGAYCVGIVLHHFGTDIEETISWGNQYLLILLITLAISAFFALFIGFLTLRTSGIFFIMITLAFGQLAFFFFNSLTLYGGEDGLSIDKTAILPFWGAIDSTTVYYLAALFWFGLYALAKTFICSRFGIIFQATASNELRARTLGFATHRYKMIGMVIAFMMAGIAGSLLALLNLFVSPQLLHWTKSADALIMVVLGGLKTLTGGFWGATVLLLAEEFLSPLFEWWHLLLGFFLVVVVLIRKGGVYHLGIHIKNELFSRIKKSPL